MSFKLLACTSMLLTARIHATWSAALYNRFHRLTGFCSRGDDVPLKAPPAAQERTIRNSGVRAFSASNPFCCKLLLTLHQIQIKNSKNNAGSLIRKV
jgi:hypothetical protein